MIDPATRIEPVCAARQLHGGQSRASMHRRDIEGARDMQFEHRPVGTTDLALPVLGLGTASLAGNGTPVSEADARATIAAALDAGITYIDTAPYYGFGKSERYAGDALRFRRDGTVVSTKVGRLLVPHTGPHARPHDWKEPLPFVDVFDYTYDGIMRSFEDSLQRLGLDSVDILFVHDIGEMTHGATENARLWDQLAKQGGYRALRELRDGGVVSAIGLGVNEWEVLMDAFALGDWDVFLLAGRYTLLEQTSLTPFLETCIARKASVVIGGPFNSGILVGGDTWNYARAPEDIVRKVGIIKSVCADFGVQMPAAAHKFPLFHPVVASVIPGPRTPSELSQILDWWQTDIPEEMWDAMAAKDLFAPGTPLPGGKTA